MTLEWQQLAQSRYLNLESYRRDGTPVHTPLWFALSGNGVTLYVYSRADAFKIKRLQRNAHCRIAACDVRGKLAGPWLDASAVIVTGADAARGMALLNRRYWPWKQLLGLAAMLRPAPRAVVALVPRAIEDPALGRERISL